MRLQHQIPPLAAVMPDGRVSHGERSPVAINPSYTVFNHHVLDQTSIIHHYDTLNWISSQLPANLTATSASMVKVTPLLTLTLFLIV